MGLFNRAGRMSPVKGHEVHINPVPTTPNMILRHYTRILRCRERLDRAPCPQEKCDSLFREINRRKAALESAGLTVPDSVEQLRTTVESLSG